MITKRKTNQPPYSEILQDFLASLEMSLASKIKSWILQEHNMMKTEDHHNKKKIIRKSEMVQMSCFASYPAAGNFERMAKNQGKERLCFK
jgi:hypothetical protein